MILIRSPEDCTVSSPVVNALSAKLDLNIYRDGNEYEIKFKDGNSIKPSKN